MEIALYPAFPPPSPMAAHPQRFKLCSHGLRRSLDSELLPEGTLVPNMATPSTPWRVCMICYLYDSCHFSIYVRLLAATATVSHCRWGGSFPWTTFTTTWLPLTSGCSLCGPIYQKRTFVHFLIRTYMLVSLSVYFPFPPTFGQKASFLLRMSLPWSVWRSQSLVQVGTMIRLAFVLTGTQTTRVIGMDQESNLNTWPWSRQIFSHCLDTPNKV